MTAAAAVGRLVPGTAYSAVPRRVDESTCAPGGPFDDTFWRNVDLVFAAVDSVDARRFLDAQSVKFGIPLVDCGTLGARASVQPAVPDVTESYGATVDTDSEEAIPVCTLKDHPFKAEHVVSWARDVFEDLFSVRSDRLRGALVAARAPGGIRKWVRESRHACNELAEVAADMDALFSVEIILKVKQDENG